MRHTPVLLQEVLDGLEIPKGGVFIDCNLGDGGHTEAVIESVSGDVTVIGFDLDSHAIERATTHITSNKNIRAYIDSGTFQPSKKLLFFRKNFRTLTSTLKDAGIYTGTPCVDSILFDLGISSYELDESGRGFTFQKDELLSMTFGSTDEYIFTAYEIVNTWDEKTIADIIFAYGEDTYAKRIARLIVEEREARKKAVAYESKDKQSIEEGLKSRTIGIRTTKELAEIVKKAYPVHARFGRTHPATKTFQALRIAVNDELRSIQEALPQALELLKPGGRLAVISFHSLEDRIVKQFFKEKMGGTSDEVDEVYGGYKPSGKAEVKAITKKPIAPSDTEIESNPRSRSSKLRIVEKL